MLRAAAADRQDVELASVGERAIRWAVATGLGPLLHHVTRGDARRESAPLWPRVQSAYLTATVVGAEQQEAMREILDRCAERGCTLTLLKGVSIANDRYPEPALRPMGDIDVLVPERDVPVVEAVLTALGYGQRSPAPDEFYATHHHTMPFFDARRRVWVEVHHRLSSPRPGQAFEDVLGPDHVSANVEPVQFLGRRAMRLTKAVQVLYVATHWASRFQLVGGAIPLMDAVYLLKPDAGSLAWSDVLAALARAPRTAAHLYALLTYLASRKVVPLAAELLHDLARLQRSFGGTNLWIVHALIDRYLLGGVEPGRVLSEDRMRIAWNTLFRPAPPALNLLALPWRVLPRRPA